MLFGLPGLALFLISAVSLGAGLLAPAAVAFLLSIGLMMVGVANWEKYRNWSSGIRGEEKVISSLCTGLDDSFCLLNDVMLRGGRGNIDHVVAGPSGLFVIETKNFSGGVVCYGDRWFTGRKTWRRPPWKKYPIPSVSQQARGNAVLLQEALSQLGFRSWVQPVVVFSNNAQLWLRNPTVPVLRLGELCGYIRSYRGNYVLDNGYVRSLTDKLLTLTT